MKKIINKAFGIASLFVLATLTNSCGDDNTVVTKVFNGTTNGAILRTVSVNSNTLNSSVPTSSWSVTVEEQDTEEGKLMESVDIFVSLKDLSPGNGTTEIGSTFVKKIPASEFSEGPLGLPRATISATFEEARAAMNIDDTQYAPGDLFVFELRLNLTDGRTFGLADSTGRITGGFFKSPYAYNAALLCSPQPGTYRVDMHDSYGDGWQTNAGNGGSGITITVTDENDVETVLEVGMCSPYGGDNVGTFAGGSDCSGTPASSGFNNASATVEIPVGTKSAVWNFPGDRYGEISFEIYGPAGQELLKVEQGQGVAGLLPVTLCL